MNYSRYSVFIGTDPAEYGSYCTQAGADSCAEMLAQLIAEEFDGIRVNVRENGSAVRGPDGDVCEEIRLWIQETGFPIAAEGGR
jgi:hypothetical protein